MAGPGNTVTLTFAGDATKLSRTFDQVGHSARKFDSGVGQVEQSTKKSFKGIGLAATAMGLAVGAAMFTFGKSAIDAASDLAETESKVKVLFGKSSDAVVAFSATAAKVVS